MVARLLVVSPILRIDLHEEFSERIDVPDAHLLLHALYHLGVGRTKNAKAQSRHTIALRDRFHHTYVGESFEQLVADERIVSIALAEINETLIEDKLYAIILSPLRQLDDAFLFRPSGQTTI